MGRWLGLKEGEYMKVSTLLKAIRSKCLDCSCFQPKEVKECNIPECSLYEYRMGKPRKKLNKKGK